MRDQTSKTPDKKSSAFLSGVFLLSLSTLLVKLTGFLTKIPLLHLLGAQGMGYYNTAYEVYAFLFVLSTAGLPVALSILISQSRGERHRILRTAAGWFILLGVAGSAVLTFGADLLATRMGNPGAGASMRAVAPAVLFICLASALRGYYQGLQDMRPTAVSQLLEAVGKMLFGIFFATLARRRGLPLNHVAAAGAWGLSGGTLLSLLYLIGRMGADAAREKHPWRSREQSPPTPKRPAQRILRRLMAIAVPITLSSGVVTLTRLLDTVLILRRLGQSGCAEAEISALYGAYSTLAVPLYSLLPMLIGSLALPLVPGIARAREVGDGAGERDIVSTSLRLTVLFGLPASLGLSAFAGPILTLLFGGGDTAVAVAQATPLLTALGASVLGGCLVTVLGAMLQAYGRPRAPLWSMLVASAVKLISAWVLLGLPQVGMLGAPISTFLCHLSAILIDLALLCPLLPSHTGLSDFGWRATAAALLSVGGTWLLYRGIAPLCPSPRLITAAALLLCVLAYLLLSLRFGALRWEDVAQFPHGEKVNQALLRLNLTPKWGKDSEISRKSG